MTEQGRILEPICQRSGRASTTTLRSRGLGPESPIPRSSVLERSPVSSHCRLERDRDFLLFDIEFQAPSCGSATGRGRAPPTSDVQVPKAEGGISLQPSGRERGTGPSGSSSSHARAQAPILCVQGVPGACVNSSNPGSRSWSGLSHFNVLVDPLGSVGHAAQS